MRPLFAKGKDMETALTQPLPAGSNTLSLDNSGGEFDVGDYIFVADSQGQKVKYLGAVTEAGIDYLKTTYSVEQEKPAGAPVWKPQDWLEWEVGRSAPLRRTYYSGVDIQRTIGGQLYSTRVAEPYSVDVLTFAKISRAMFFSFEDWYKTVINRGLEQFTCIDEWRKVTVVKILNTELLHNEQYPQVASIEIHLAIIAEEAYF